jgi:hypothetical protein
MMNLNSANNINLNMNNNYSNPKSNVSCCNNLINNNTNNSYTNNIGYNNVIKPTANDTLKAESKLFERRNVSALQQLNYCGFANNGSNGGGGGGGAASGYAGLNTSANSKLDPATMNLNYLLDDDWRASLLGFYEPPKPDTPPSRIIPFWVDPIWNSSGGGCGGEATQSVETVSKGYSLRLLIS